MTDHCDDARALSDFVRGENGFKGCPLADVVDARPESIRKDEEEARQ